MRPFIEYVMIAGVSTVVVWPFVFAAMILYHMLFPEIPEKLELGGDVYADRKSAPPVLLKPVENYPAYHHVNFQTMFKN